MRSKNWLEQERDLLVSNIYEYENEILKRDLTGDALFNDRIIESLRRYLVIIEDKISERVEYEKFKKMIINMP